MNIRPLEAGSPPEVDQAGNVPHPAASKTAAALVDESSRVALPGAAEIAAMNKLKAASKAKSDVAGVEKTSPVPPGEEEKSVDAVKEASMQHPSLDHLSAPSSRIQSGTATPQTDTVSGPPDGVGEPAGARTHRGSEIIEAPLEEIKRIEDEHALQEDPEEESEVEATKRMRTVSFEDTETVQSEEATDGAAKSVDD